MMIENRTGMVILGEFSIYRSPHITSRSRNENSPHKMCRGNRSIRGGHIRGVKS
jgi:hypothetical protein